MDQVHLHLLFNHLAIYGSILGAFVLAYGMAARSRPTCNAAYFIFIAAACGAGIAYYTGEAAEDSVEKMLGVAKSMIEEHEDFAKVALISAITLGVFSLLALILGFLKPSWAGRAAIVTLAVALVTFGLAARTGYLGGQIRHTELNRHGPAVQEQEHGDEDGE